MFLQLALLVVEGQKNQDHNSDLAGQSVTAYNQQPLEYYRRIRYFLKYVHVHLQVFSSDSQQFQVHDYNSLLYVKRLLSDSFQVHQYLAYIQKLPSLLAQQRQYQQDRFSLNLQVQLLTLQDWNKHLIILKHHLLHQK